MNIIEPMTALAITLQFLLVDVARVAAMAVELCMRAVQAQMCIAPMIEGGWLPRFIRVALSTLRAHARCMSIVRAMTPGAGLGNFLLEIAGAVATRTGHIGVRPAQRKAGCRCVIETRALPLKGGVAVRASRAT
jgi:hypothetical protein